MMREAGQLLLFTRLLALCGAGYQEHHVTVINRCPAKAHIEYKHKQQVTAYPDIIFDVDALTSSTSQLCFDGRSMKVSVGANVSCDTESVPFDCRKDHNYVMLECDDDADSPARCAARPLAAACVGFGDMGSFCPARSRPAKDSLGKDYGCGSRNIQKMPNGDLLDSDSSCPICLCEEGSACVGRDCGYCGDDDAVTRSADAVCLPTNWVPTSPDYRAPTMAPSSRHGMRIDDDDTAEPNIGPVRAKADISKPKSRRHASGVATFIIVMIAVAIGGIALRRFLVTSQNSAGWRGSTYVDIPATNNMGSSARYQYQQQQQQQEPALEMMNHNPA